MVDGGHSVQDGHAIFSKFILDHHAPVPIHSAALKSGNHRYGPFYKFLACGTGLDALAWVCGLSHGHLGEVSTDGLSCRIT